MKYQCDNYNIARSQRKHEILRFQGKSGTEGYERMGCYRCDGLNEFCQGYSNELNLVVREGKLVRIIR